MKILYHSVAGLSPSRTDRLAGMIDQTDVVSLELRTVESDSRERISNHDRAAIFASILHALTEQRTSRLLFRYDLSEVRRKLQMQMVPVNEERGWLVVDLTLFDIKLLANLLELISFTTCYLQVDGSVGVVGSPVELFNALQGSVLVATLLLFDGAVEIVSPVTTAEAIFNTVQRVAQATGIPIALRP